MPQTFKLQKHVISSTSTLLSLKFFDMPQLAVFPKAYMPALCKDGSMTCEEWIQMTASLNIDGLEWYAGFLQMSEENNWSRFRGLVEGQGRSIPMLCCSPDFTHADRYFRHKEVEKQKRWITMISALGGRFCRVLSGQKRPELSMEQGLDFTVECIKDCLPHAVECGVTLVIENHYKDDFWKYPEFAQKMDVFCALIDRIDHPNFGVNYDPSNAYLAGDDPIALLNVVAPRVKTMHASDRFLKHGTLEDLRKEENNAEGYAKRLSHGEVGKGLNDYDQIFSILKSYGFDGWISIEDGIDGFDQLQRSVTFVREKIETHWGR